MMPCLPTNMNMNMNMNMSLFAEPILGPPSVDILKPKHELLKLSRRHLCSSSSFFTLFPICDTLLSKPVRAQDNEPKDDGIIASLKSLFDPNQLTKSGKVLPKAYLKSARQVIKTLRESLDENPQDIPKFRRSADAAKQSIRDYLNNWRGQPSVSNHQSYQLLEKAFRSLADFYTKAGPSASLSAHIKSSILRDLDTAEQFL